MNKRTWAGLIIGLVLLTAGAVYFWSRPPVPPLPSAPVPALPTPEPAPVATAPARSDAAVAEADAPAELPTLEASDASVRGALIEVFGAPPVEAYLVPDRIVRRLVATIDSLDADPVRPKSRPLPPVEGRVLVEKVGDTLLLSPRNAERYEAYVSALDAADARAIARFYRRYAPLFQRAYEELGYPGRRFDDRLLAIIDHLLDAPEPPEPVELLRPKVLYQFADPKLESLSWGQKTLVRIGASNAAVVKAKLRELRAALLAG
ncbi:DUF3014 domain-containing protein [Fontimonas sp. SYSU GA230001]|uniref:DUF3014 domain-containing protein n=1 Tax=Fontimonas sp. SYSU GA230001 TaxID=3142450 RepID=UPI0032B48882